jgi:hypothetical protein
MLCGTAFSRDSRWIATVCDDDSVQLFDVSSGACSKTLAGEAYGFCGGSRWGGHSLTFSGDLFAATGGGTDFNKLRLWPVPGFGVRATIPYDENVYCCQLSPDGRTLAVGCDGGVIHVHQTDQLGEPSLRLITPVGSGGVRSLRFSPDNSVFASGQWSGTFRIWNVASTEPVARFKHPESNGLSLAFSPGGDILAAGGAQFQRVVFHRVLTAKPAFRFGVTEETTKDDISEIGRILGQGPVKGPGAPSVSRTEDARAQRGLASAFGAKWDIQYAEMSQKLVVIAFNGPALCVYLREDGATLCILDMGARIYGHFQTSALAIRADDAQVAAVLGPSKFSGMGAGGSVVVRAIPTGEEVYRVTKSPAKCFGCCWSTDGVAFVVYGDFGADVHSADTGEFQACYDKGRQVVCAAASEELLVTTDATKCCNVYDWRRKKEVHSWAEGSSTLGCFFDASGERLVYSTQYSVVVRETASGTLLRRFAFTAGSRSAFSPLDSDLLVIGSGQGRILQSFGRRLRVVSVKTGKELNFSALMHARMSVDKIRAPAVGATVDIVSGTRLMVHVAEKTHLVQMDLGTFEASVNDGAFDSAQLMALSERRPDAIETVAKERPDAVNIPDSSGDTVLHMLARKDCDDEVAKWLCPGGAMFTPIANSDGRSALHEAVLKFNVPLVTALVNTLSPNLSAKSARLLTLDLRVPGIVLS